jgi:hypothetical protein
MGWWRLGGLAVLASSWTPRMDSCSTCSRSFELIPNDGLGSRRKLREGGEQECEGGSSKSQV